MPFVSGFLRLRRGGHPDQGLPGIDEPVDPDYGIGSEYPDQGLPTRPGPIDPGFGHPLPPIDPGYGRPEGGGGHPAHPIYPTRPTYPVDPDYGLPVRPGIWPSPPRPPGPVDPDYGLGPPLHPSHPIYGVRPPHAGHPLPHPPARPDQGLPAEGGGAEVSPPIYLPGHVWPPLPPSVTGHALCFCWIVGVGWRWVVIDCSASIEHPIAPGYPGHPDNALPPVAQPK